MNQTLWQSIYAHVVKTGEAPSAAEIHAAADFSQAGPIRRLCDALVEAAEFVAKARNAPR